MINSCADTHALKTAILHSEVKEEVCSELLKITLSDPDWRWVQEQCLSLFGSREADVAGLAVTCLGHLARIHGRLDINRVFPVLYSEIDNPKLGARIRDALEDIEIFIGKKSKKFA